MQLTLNRMEKDGIITAVYGSMRIIRYRIEHFIKFRCSARLLPEGLPVSDSGNDQSIFYNNVKDNVAKRIAAYKADAKSVL